MSERKKNEPIAWAKFADNGNIQIWTSSPDEARKIADSSGFELHPLYTSPTPTVKHFWGNSLRTDALCQLSYCNGLKAGWNFCVDDNEAGYSNAMNGIIEAVRVLKQNRDTEPLAVAVNKQMLKVVQDLIGMLENCEVKSGVCHCGDSMDSHSGPMYAGHSPTDYGTSFANLLLTKARAAIAAAEAAKKGGV